MSSDENRFLTEYSKAQDSAEHHDNLIWTATGVIYAANVALLIFVIKKDTLINHRITSTLLGLLGMLMIVCVWLLSDTLIALKKRKYKRCKELEDKFGFEQHRNESKNYPSGRQRLVYNLCMGMFFFVWGVVLTLIWNNANIGFLTNPDGSLANQKAFLDSFVANILTFILILVTIVYVVVTSRILKANHQAVKIMGEQLEASFRPYIVPSTFVIPGNMMICLKISNTGKMAAENVKLELDRDFYQYGETDDKYNIKTAYAFKNTIETFVPGMELLFYLGMGFQIFKNETDPKFTPSEFQITAMYSYPGRKVSEKTVINLEAYRKTSLPPQEATVTQLKEIVKAIDKLNK